MPLDAPVMITHLSRQNAAESFTERLLPAAVLECGALSPLWLNVRSAADQNDRKTGALTARPDGTSSPKRRQGAALQNVTPVAYSCVANASTFPFSRLT